MLEKRKKGPGSNYFANTKHQNGGTGKSQDRFTSEPGQERRQVGFEAPDVRPAIEEYRMVLAFQDMKGHHPLDGGVRAEQTVRPGDKWKATGRRSNRNHPYETIVLFLRERPRETTVSKIGSQ